MYTISGDVKEFSRGRKRKLDDDTVAKMVEHARNEKVLMRRCL